MENFREAPEVDNWIDKLLNKHSEFNKLKKMGFRSIFRFNEKKKGNKFIYASVSQVPERYLLYIDADLIVEVWYDGWCNLNDNEKEALIYHELCHCDIVEKEEKIRIKLIPHDFEGFVKEYEKFGNWRGDLPDIANTYTDNVEKNSEGDENV